MAKRPFVNVCKFALVAALLIAGVSAQAGDVNWSGLFRFEALQMHDPALDGSNRNKSYGLTHLILKPTFIPADGFVVHARFDIMNSASTLYPNSQLGQFLGDGVNSTGVTGSTTPNTGTTNQNSNTLSNHEASNFIAVNELYLTYTHPFGQLIIGRAPIQFGLGITHNAGNGPFDHWLDNRDMVAYKAVYGNFFVMPMYAKVAKGPLDQDQDVTDYMLQAQYHNPDDHLTMGVFVQSRVASSSANDTPTALGGTGGTNNHSSRYNMQATNFFVGKKTPNFNVGVEAGLTSGTIGVTDSTGKVVGASGFGAAAELNWQPAGSAFSFGLKTGLATGDAQGTTKDEGFVFNPNYHVAEMLFTQPLGQYDLFRTETARANYADAANQVDDESISNVFYISPSVKHPIFTHWSLNGRLTYARLNTSPILNEDVSKDVGMELDLGANYSPYKRLIWENTVAALWPGGAFHGGANEHYPASFAYGLFTKAAISF